MTKNKMIILVGLPGSGKSTFARKYDNYKILNQDLTNGGKKALLKKCEYFLKENRNVVIDRCNMSPKQRKPFIDLAKKYNAFIEVVILIVSPSICENRIANRLGHPTVSKEMTWVVKRHLNINSKADQKYPILEEGIDYIKKLFWSKKDNKFKNKPDK